MTTIRPRLDDEQIGERLHDLADPYDGLQSEFTRACAQFAEARRLQQAKDTPAHRNAVLTSRARIDAILDTYLELRQG